MNLVDLKSSSVTGNSVRNAGYGISLWSLAKMDGVTVSRNTVAIAQLTPNIPSSWGIATSYNRGVSGWVSYGIGLQTLGNIANGLFLETRFCKRRCVASPSGSSDAKYTTSRVSVRNNLIINVGSNFSSSAAPYRPGQAAPIPDSVPGPGRSQ